MLTRRALLGKAVDDCLKELYTLAQPEVTWEAFENQCTVYSNNYKRWESYRKAFHDKENNPKLWEQYKATYPDWEDKSITECIGPKPFEFYYLPREIMKEVCDAYIEAYRLDEKQEFLDNIETLKNYCKAPIVDKYIDDWIDETGFHHPGYRSYDHPDNLEKEIKKILGDIAEDNEYYQHKLQDKFFEFLDMAGNFFNWNRYLNAFNMEVYLGPSPNSNKEAVIENWKKYRNKDIEIDESKYKEEDYDDYD